MTSIRLRNTGGFRFVRQDVDSLFGAGHRELAERGAGMIRGFLLTEIPLEQTEKSIIMNSRQCVLELVVPKNMEVRYPWPGS